MIVTNRRNIEATCNNYYKINEERKPIQITKMAAHVDSYGLGVDDIGSLAFALSSDEAEHHHPLHWSAIQKYLDNCFSILPIEAYYEHGINLTLTWYANNPIFINSESELINLYISFADFLGSITQGEIKDPPFQVLKICFYPTFTDLISAKTSTNNIIENSDGKVLFTKEIFHSPDPTSFVLRSML